MKVEEIFSDLITLETPRLRLRKIVQADLDDIFAYASDVEVARYTSWSAHATLADSQALIDYAQRRYQLGKVAPWGIEYKGDGRLIGTCGYLEWDIANGWGEIGYALSRLYWRQGLMREAVEAILEFGFQKMGLNRVQAVCEAGNLASAQLLTRLGMQAEGRLREAVRTKKGGYADLLMYGLLAREWHSHD